MIVLSNLAHWRWIPEFKYHRLNECRVYEAFWLSVQVVYYNRAAALVVEDIFNGKLVAIRARGNG
jgi:hypothetical protein